MKKCLLWLCSLMVISCGDNAGQSPDAQQIVDRAIEVAGGEAYANSLISFKFRGRTYEMEPGRYNRTLKRITLTDTAVVTDIKIGEKFLRKIDGQEVAVADSMAVKYASSVNSVHYFVYLPYGLNDAAVNKKLLGEAEINGRTYYKVQVTFDQEGGGKDFDDIYVYWFDKETFKPDYLAYEFHVDGGGLRFRKAYNERYVNGLRFVDYENYAYEKGTHPAVLDSLYQAGELELLSRIELVDIRVNPDSGS